MRVHTSKEESQYKPCMGTPQKYGYMKGALGFFFFCLKTFPQIIFLIFLRHLITKLQTKGIKLNLLFKLLYLNSNFLLTLCYLTPVVQ